jgi:hypothetical protein
MVAARAPPHGHNVLGLARGNIGEVDAADNTLARDRGVCLPQSEWMADDGLKLVESIPLHEDTAVIRTLHGRQFERTRYAQLADLHVTNLTWPSVDGLDEIAQHILRTEPVARISTAQCRTCDWQCA